VQNCGNGNGTNPTTGSLSGSFTLTSNNNFCVGQTPVYTITSQSSLSGQTINWTSTHGGVTAGQSTFTLDISGYWSASGNMWGSSDIGSWQKTAVINGLTQTLTFSVQNCGNSNNTNNSNLGTIGGSTGGLQTIGGSTAGGSGQTLGGSVGTGSETFGGSVYGNQTIGGSTGGLQTIGGSVSGGGDPIIGNPDN
jgi:hypothetical protein